MLVLVYPRHLTSSHWFPFVPNEERGPQTLRLQQAAVSGYNLITSFPCIYF